MPLWRRVSQITPCLQHARHFPRSRYAMATVLIDKKTNEAFFDANDNILKELLCFKGRNYATNMASLYAYDCLAQLPKKKNKRSHVKTPLQKAHNAFKRYRRHTGLSVGVHTRGVLGQNQILADEWKREKSNGNVTFWETLDETFPKTHEAWQKDFKRISEWVTLNAESMLTFSSDPQ